jgi:hypothetical protein
MAYSPNGECETQNCTGHERLTENVRDSTVQVTRGLSENVRDSTVQVKSA